MVEQFAFAIIFLFLYCPKLSGLTSGTTKGISLSILKCLELSITIVFLAAIGTHSSAIALPAEKKAILIFEKSKSFKPTREYSLFLKLTFFPILL